MDFSNGIAKKLEVTFAVVPSEGRAGGLHDGLLDLKKCMGWRVDFFCGESAVEVRVKVIADGWWELVL
jgi:hypothetical protein